MANRALTVLTPGERLWIDRGRRQETQAEAAARIGVPERRYNHMERDMLPAGKPPRIKPTAAEQCALARRRDGRDLRTLGLILGGCSHVTLLAWEAVADPRLVREWEGAGYKFS